ncbi:MAG: DUF1223 domain-containing protein [Acidobacteria bacterium]|nr:DUF1223 domain-containing protein [Acidobacteriota bacterium]
MRFLMGLLVTGSLLAMALVGGRSEDLAAAEPAPGEAPSPVLVELFTSEGCSSCPPADALLMRLDQEATVAGAEVIVLSEHVDYWNYIGWTDPFSSPQYSERQKVYAETLGSQVYTPQMVVDGSEDFLGSDGQRARAAIARASRKRKARVEIQAVGGNAAGKFRLALRVTELPAGTAGEAADLLVAITEDHLTVAVPRGENSGRRLSHTSVVRRLERVAELDGEREFSMELEVPAGAGWKAKDLRAVAIVQERQSRRVRGVGQTRFGAE